MFLRLQNQSVRDNFLPAVNDLEATPTAESTGEGVKGPTSERLNREEHCGAEAEGIKSATVTEGLNMIPLRKRSKVTYQVYPQHLCCHGNTRGNVK